MRSKTVESQTAHQHWAVRSAAALLILALPPALWWGGAQPIAVGLVPSPWDKGLHAAVFAGLAVALGYAGGWRGRRLMVIAVSAALLVGGIDEWHQSMLPGRQAGWDDLAADVLGAWLGAALLAKPRHRSGPRHA